MWTTDIGSCVRQIQENRRFASIVASTDVQFGGGDLNLAVSTVNSPSHAVMKQITDDTDMRYHPTLEYRGSEDLCQANVSNVHDRTARHCYDMCTVPVTNATFTTKIFAVPGDVAYLLALRAAFEEQNILPGGPVVHYGNKKRSDHHVMVILSW